MMNDEKEQFEQRLRRQTVKQVPAAWRAEILAAVADDARSQRSETIRKMTLAEALMRRVRELLWPHPAAWAGLAAVWLFVFGINFSMREQSPTLAIKTSPPSPEEVSELRQQHRLYAELVGMPDTVTRDVKRPRDPLSKPRSERAEILAA